MERTVSEIIPALKHRNDEELSVKIKQFEEKLNLKQKELSVMEKTLGMSEKSKEEMTDHKKEDQKGVLV